MTKRLTPGHRRFSDVSHGRTAVVAKDERINFIWVTLLMILLLTDPTITMCPARCRCNDETLQTSCSNAGLEVVPIQLNPEMQCIDLSCNKIYDVHFTLTFYHHLVSLNLSTNKIQRLGSSNFDSQRNLKHLNLSYNEIQTLSKDSFKGLRNLTNLDLSFNRLEELPSLVFRELHSLQTLKLSNNQLVYLEEGLLSHVKQLEELLLDDNQLLEVPGSAIADATNLKVISLSRNLIASIQEGDMPILLDLRVLLLDTNVINKIHPGALAGLSTLEELDLSDNNFTSVPTSSLAKLSNLMKLSFGGNFICSIPPVAFRGLFQLRYLRLNRLDFLTRIDSRAFVDNVNLEKICFDDNIAMRNLPTRLFYGNPRVTNISVRNNHLVTLEVLHFPLDQLKALRLGGNPLQCNCSLLWLWRLLQEQNNKKSEANDTDGIDLNIDSSEIRCAGPETLANSLLLDASESKVDCSLGWVAILCIVLLVVLLLIIAGTIIYFGPIRRRLNSSERPPVEITPRPASTSLNHPYEESPVDKYIIEPSLIRDYRALSPWESFAKKQDMEACQKFNGNVKPRPHIVYV